ncbi:flagellar type III secretion system protein FlhB [Tritonibacter horizontis]|uniref:Flagellar biosynthetic protein FlhB n=1 Tax=Tritonibacter horizontis TaxID=1768241 RepID=A0A132C3F3_9RHOB|nr:flagellar type III secretion system protein FlhB [Tritonibacter horizontis]KUP94762.1 flagellar biosynthetic protein FlhB [Tritonibacter horizontis]
MSDDSDDSDKSFEPTPEKLRKARLEGDVPKSNDLLQAAGYMGTLIAFYTAGRSSIEQLGTVLMSMIDQPDRLAPVFFGEGMAAPISGQFITTAFKSVLPWFVMPAALVLLAVFAQRAMVFAPKRIEPKLSRLSIIKNAKNKFGRGGLFEFAKSFAKLLLYSVALGVYLSWRVPEMIASVGTSPYTVVPFLVQLGMEFLLLTLIISLGIGLIDAPFQQAEFIRKNMMSRKDVTDEMKNSEGDPHTKGQRKQKGRQIVAKQIKAAVTTADVVIVNPTHYAVALKWSRISGSAPECVAKGVDDVAAIIREIAQEHGVPLHSDPPTARALYATVEVGEEIAEEHYAPVAAAVRFAEEMRKRAKDSAL